MRILCRNLVLALIIGVLCSSIVKAQIKVSENGKVGIKYDNTPLSNLVLNHEGHSDYESYFYSPSRNAGGCLLLKSEYSSGYSAVHSLYSYITSGQGYSFGVKSYAYNASPKTAGRAYGVVGYAGNATSGWNYGVYGKLMGSNNGTGVFGANTTKSDISIPGKYAGYFRGDVKVEDALWAYSITESDERFKENVKDISDEESLVKFPGIRPVEYNLVQRELTMPSDTTITVNYFEEDSQILNKKKFGLIAQELQLIYPNLVYEGQAGELGIDYVGLIPILIKTVQEQQLRIEQLEQAIKSINPEAVRYEDN